MTDETRKRLEEESASVCVICGGKQDDPSHSILTCKPSLQVVAETAGEDSWADEVLQCKTKPQAITLLRAFAANMKTHRELKAARPSPAPVVHDKAVHLLAYDPECEVCRKEGRPAPEVVEALRKYGKHLYNCAALHIRHKSEANKPLNESKCNCGLRAALASYEAAIKGTKNVK